MLERNLCSEDRVPARRESPRLFEDEDTIVVRDLSHREFERILIIKPSSFGDVIHALPVLNGLRRRFGHARISWMVANSCAGLLDGHPALDEVIRFDRKRYGLIGRSFQITVEFVEFVQFLRGRAFDLVVDLQGLFRSGFMAMASGAGTRVGFADARELAWMFYNCRVAAPDREMHAVERNYLVGRLLGFADVPIAFNLPVPAEARASLWQMLAAEGLSLDQPFVVMGPGTRWETKRWPAEFFAAVARRIRADHGWPVVLTGMDGEGQIAQQVAELAGVGVVNLAGRTSLAQMIALVAAARILVMHDSGPMHLATAFNKPMVAIYGPTSPARTGPYGRGEIVARLDLPCSPCYLKKLSECPYDHRCMRELSPEMVADQVSRTLAEEVPAL